VDLAEPPFVLNIVVFLTVSSDKDVLELKQSEFDSSFMIGCLNCCSMALEGSNKSESEHVLLSEK